MTKFGVGQAAARIEDRVLVTGAGAYTDDTSIDGQAWACVLRSPHAHARILGIDSAEAAISPGVVGILTGADMAADRLGDLPLPWSRSRTGTVRSATTRRTASWPATGCAMSAIR